MSDKTLWELGTPTISEILRVNEDEGADISFMGVWIDPREDKSNRLAIGAVIQPSADVISALNELCNTLLVNGQVSAEDLFSFMDTFATDPNETPEAGRTLADMEAEEAVSLLHEAGQELRLVIQTIGGKQGELTDVDLMAMTELVNKIDGFLSHE